MSSTNRPTRVILDPIHNEDHYLYVTEVTYYNHMSEVYSGGLFGKPIDVDKGIVMADKAMKLFLNPPFHFTHVDEQHPDNMSILEYVRNYPGDIFSKLFLSSVFERKFFDLF